MSKKNEKERASESLESVDGEGLASQYEGVPSGPSPIFSSPPQMSSHVVFALDA